MAEFTKGQTVFQACTHFAERDDAIELRVISRVVDACGQKQVTFEDHGHDGVFGRRIIFGRGPDVFATAEEAFAALANTPNHTRKSVVINPAVVSDATWVPAII